MLSWILRHRVRLAVIYGLAPTPPLAGRRFSARPLAARDAGSGPTGEPEHRGLLRRRARGQVELRPMPRRLA